MQFIRAGARAGSALAPSPGESQGARRLVGALKGRGGANLAIFTQFATSSAFFPDH